MSPCIAICAILRILCLPIGIIVGLFFDILWFILWLITCGCFTTGCRCGICFCGTTLENGEEVQKYYRGCAPWHKYIFGGCKWCVDGCEVIDV